MQFLCRVVPRCAALSACFWPCAWDPASAFLRAALSERGQRRGHGCWGNQKHADLLCLHPLIRPQTSSPADPVCPPPRVRPYPHPLCIRTPAETDELTAAGFRRRVGVQYHWVNRGCVLPSEGTHSE